MKGLNICINSQTPLFRFKLEYAELLEKYGQLPDPVPIEILARGEDYEINPGGVPKIVYPMISQMIKENIVKKADWVSLNPTGPQRVTAGKVLIHNVSPDPHELGAYARMKERIWEEVHDLKRHEVGSKEFAAYARYNWICASKMLELIPTDLFYVHDFQQLQLGGMIGLAAPTIFRWHIPLTLETADPYIRNFIVRCMEAFDAVIVSCRRDLQGLIRAGYHGKAFQVHPPVDKKRWTKPSSNLMSEFCSTFGIEEDDRVILVVARMDRMKGQDLAIKAVSRLAREFPRLKLMLVGNGSFSGSAVGGLAHPKATTWTGELQGLVRKLGMEKRVIFTGYLRDEFIKAAYARSDVVVLSSRKEGFGLVVGEAWVYKKPVVVSRGAGISELLIEGSNGFTFESGDTKALAKKLRIILRDSEKAGSLGQRGRETVRALYMDRTIKVVSEIMEEVIKSFKK
jgi:glycosyltransferase involved in cell wall biosynthesis